MFLSESESSKASKAQCMHTFLHSTDQFELFHFQLMRMIVESRSILIQLLQSQSITDCRSGQSTAVRLAAVPHSAKFMLCQCRRMLQQVIYTKLEQLKYNLKGYLDFHSADFHSADSDRISKKCISVVFLDFLLYSSKFRQWRYEPTCRKLNERRGDDAWDMAVILVLH